MLSAVKHIGVKIINSRAYHPQSKGKVERSHPGLRDKIRYDILRKGANWVEALPEYQSIINDEVKAELGGKSPFQIYYSRTTNFILKPNADSDPEIEGDYAEFAPKILPEIEESELKSLERRRELLTAAAYKASNKCAKVMVNRAMKMKPLPIYDIYEKVPLRFPFKYGKKGPKKRLAILAKIKKRNVTLSKYEVMYKNPDTKKTENNWVSVKDITSRTRRKEVNRKKFTSLEEILIFFERDEKLKNLYIVLSLEDRFQNLFERAGYSIRLNPLSDGNCQFAAIANQLQAHNVTAISSFDLRELVVNYIIEFRSSPFNVRPDFGELIDDSRYSSFEDYVNRMRMNTTFGDHLTLQAISELYLVRINVVSTEGSNHNRMIEPQENSVDIPTLSIGYDPESLHYFSISEIIDFQIHDLTGNGNVNGRRDMEVGSEQDGDGQMSDDNGDDMGAGRGHMVDGQGIMGDQESMVDGTGQTEDGE